MISPSQIALFLIDLFIHEKPDYVLTYFQIVLKKKTTYVIPFKKINLKFGIYILRIELLFTHI